MNILWILNICLILHHLEFTSGTVVSLKITGNSSVAEGETIKLTCEATCDNGTCGYVWTGYQIPTASKNQQILTLTNVNRTYRDKDYTCAVTDKGDNDKKQVTKKFDVFYGPDTVSVAVGSQLTVIEGSQYANHDISCKASECNPPCITFKWFRSKDMNKSISQDKKLFPTKGVINRKDAGSYICSASNEKNLSRTGEITITVNYPPDVTLTWAKSESTLKCQADGIPNKYTFQDFRQYQYRGKTLLKIHKFNVSGNTATLQLMDKNYQMTGEYFCYVTNGIGSNQSKSTEIQIEDKPRIVMSKSSYNVSKGSQLDIVMDLYSLPVVKESEISVESSTLGRNNSLTVMYLTKELVNLKFYDKMISMLGQKLILTLEKVLEEDFATYTVAIGNTIGNVISSINILPEGPPDVPKNFIKDVTSTNSVSFILVTGFFNGAEQTLVVEHRHEGQEEWSNRTYKDVGNEKNKREKLEVNGLDPETMYEFRAYAFNLYDRSNYTEVIREKTSAEPNYAAAIAGGVLGGLALLVIISLLVVFILRRRKRDTETNGGMDRNLNKDLTLKMPTSPLYENNCRSAENMIAEDESTCPVTPDQTSNIYENANIKTGNMDHMNAAPYDIPPSNEGISRVTPYDTPRSNQGLYKNPLSQNQLYDVPQVPIGVKENHQSQKYLYDIPRSKKNLYDLPKPSKEVNKSKQKHDYQKSLFDDDQAGHELYDSPPSHDTCTGSRGDIRDNVDALPSYLDLNNPNPSTVEEAYVDVFHSSSLAQQSKKKPKFGKQETISDDDYLDMSELNKDKESPYVNTKQSSKLGEPVDNGSNKEVKDYQNVEQFKKSKSPPAVSKKPKKTSKNVNKVSKKTVPAVEDDSKDYQNVDKYKKVTKEPSVESAELYMTMSTEASRQSVTSLPGFQAPPPPTVLEENYMNFQVGKSK